MSLTPGSRLGPYEIVAPLGAGGMGEVYRAKDTRLDREVAVKVLPEGFAANDQFRARFEREAKSISSLNHPNICTLHDIGQQDGLMFLVMERIEGESLADRLAKGPLPLEQVLRTGAEIASGLDAAHRRGIVHRDLKPGNVMLTRTGAKILDFGLAKTGNEAPPPVDGLTSLPTEQRPLTQEGTILGTFQYMSPEQLEGEEVDARSDLFALGAVLYEMATGKRAFVGKNKTSLIAAIVSSQPPPISSVQPVAPPALDHVVRKCLEKDPEDRWQSAHDVASQLRWISEAGSLSGVPAPQVSKRKNRERLAWAIAGAAAASALAVLALHLLEPKQEIRPLVAAIAPPEKLAFDLSWKDAGTLTLSPDGRLLTFMAKGEDGKRALYVRSLETGEARAIPGTDDALYPFWSPDSRFLAFFAGGKLMKADVQGGPPLALCEVGTNPRRGSWSRDDVIVFSRNSLGGLFRIPASGGEATPLTQLDKAKAETTHRWPCFLPDGRHFLYMAATHAAGIENPANAVYLADLGSGQAKLLFHARTNVEYAAGHLLYVRDHILLAQPFDERKLELSGNPVPVAERIQYDPDFYHAGFAVSSHGELVYLSSEGDKGVVAEWVDRQGKSQGPVRGFPPKGNIGLGTSLSPDGNTLAVSLSDPATGRTDIWMVDLKRGASTRLTFGGGDENGPCWSPDGKRILYGRLDGSFLNLFSRAVDGQGGEQEVFKSESHKMPWDWSRDGRFVAVNVVDPTTKPQNDIWILRMDGSGKMEPYLATPFAEVSPKFSPDGRWIAYWGNETGTDALYIASFPKPVTKYQIASSFGGPPRVAWESGGREIFYVAGDGTMSAVEVTPRGEGLDLGAPRSLFKVSALSFWVPDHEGKRFILGHNSSGETSSITLITDWTRRLRR
ncbi:MAG TPA: protein kinase [Candidatus Polarisedimenticolia bacterium]|nr:protein kinase [Candidatus Polarisedimenticolia bacterium]